MKSSFKILLIVALAMLAGSAFAAKPASPTNAGAPVTALTATSMTLNWIDNQGGGANAEDGFNVYSSADGFVAVAYTAPANATSLAISGLTPATLYTFRIYAQNTFGQSISYAYASATTNDVPPASPTAAFVTLNGAFSQRVNWTDNSTNEDGFNIYVSLDGFSYNLFDQVLPNTLFLDAMGLTPSTLYYWRVYAFNTGNESASYAQTSETTLTILPVEMTSFTATGSDGRVTLRWSTETETNNSHFNLYRSTVQGERGNFMASVSGNGTSATSNRYSFVDHIVSNGTTYFYTISDVSLEGVESFSHFTTSATPAPHALGEIPFKYTLSQNFPNPFNPTTSITYGIHKAGNVSLKIYNELGKEVATLVEGFQSPNTYSIEFNAAALPSGTYYYSLKTEGFTTTKKMTLTK